MYTESEPYERGNRHGPGDEAQLQAPADAWHEDRRLVNAWFLRRYDKEYLGELKGIADGAAALLATGA